MTKAKFMGMPMEEFQHHIDEHIRLMENLSEATFDEKIESIKNHLEVLQMLKVESKQAFEDCKMGIIKIVCSL
ncbi:MAG: hypothetical protein WCG82_08795 [Bacteroidota bacterium]